MQHGTSYSSTHSFKTLHFLFESRLLYFKVSSRLVIKEKDRIINILSFFIAHILSFTIVFKLKRLSIPQLLL